MRNRDNIPVVVKKSDFLESLFVVYKDASEQYLTALINGLQIIRKHKFYERIDFNQFKGVIQL